MLITEKNLSTSVQGIDEARYGHETAQTTVTISSINVEELLEISSTLRGDEAIIEVSNLVEFNQFQFYRSSIKSFLQTSALDILVSFNSTLVQLKVNVFASILLLNSSFNSTLVQLKALSFTL